MRKNILEFSANEVKSFLLKSESYVPLNLPSYFDFNTVLTLADEILSRSNNDLTTISKSKSALSQDSNTNYNLLINKNGLYDWRPVQIIHPLPYVYLVNLICENWQEVIERFKIFRQNPRINCISLPVESTSITKNDVAETILNWWENLEQASITYSLEYSHCIKVDITNCYGSIYTHSVDWAIRGKDCAKNHRTGKSFGHLLDSCLQYMQYGQTNGIPQAGVLFDFIAEIVLGYSDYLLSEAINDYKKTTFSLNYQIIRYRDDYRIFTNSEHDANIILKLLSDVLSGLNMHFNSKKTEHSIDIIEAAVKPDKIYWTQQRQLVQTKTNNAINYHLTLQKHLLQIRILSQKYPNSGSVITALNEFYNRIENENNIRDKHQLISIIVDILFKSPKSAPQSIGILSYLINNLDSEEKHKVLKNIFTKITAMPNSGFIEIWFQRLSLNYAIELNFKDPLCVKVSNAIEENFSTNIWSSDWLSINFNENGIINNTDISPIISKAEFFIFDSYTLSTS